MRFFRIFRKGTGSTDFHGKYKKKDEKDSEKCLTSAQIPDKMRKPHQRGFEVMQMTPQERDYKNEVGEINESSYRYRR